MSLMVFFFVLSLFPRDVLDEIWDLIESLSEGSPNYFFIDLSIRVLGKRRKGQTIQEVKWFLWALNKLTLSFNQTSSA